MSDLDALLDQTEACCRVAAAQVSRRYQDYVTFREMFMDAGTWVLRHPILCTSRLEDGEHGSRRLTNQIGKHLDGVARAAKAYGLYSVDDEAFYTTAMVEAALPSVWDMSLMQHPPDTGEAEFRKQHSDPSVQNTWMVICIDVRNAWAKATMTAVVREALVLRHREGLAVYQVGEALGVPTAQALTLLGKGVRSMIGVLGGPAPGRCEVDCECGSNPSTGSREVGARRG